MTIFVPKKGGGPPTINDGKYGSFFNTVDNGNAIPDFTAPALNTLSAAERAALQDGDLLTTVVTPTGSGIAIIMFDFGQQRQLTRAAFHPGTGSFAAFLTTTYFNTMYGSNDGTTWNDLLTGEVYTPGTAANEVVHEWAAGTPAYQYFVKQFNYSNGVEAVRLSECEFETL